MFTPHERRQLRLIEEWFETDDPELATTLRNGPVRKPSRWPQMMVLSLACLLFGLGVATGAFVLIFTGMVAGATFAGMVVYRRNKLK
ncbi:DUF3040 domain-containing protein [Kibdelosporangium lantanae]|uniref:DUF3040 domain-containing protein n=1 Tax=Kibdelosporangium lantanae TaxID=1497396 RepID=A0ABW3MI27_9PSEU